MTSAAPRNAASRSWFILPFRAPDVEPLEVEVHDPDEVVGFSREAAERPSVSGSSIRRPRQKPDTRLVPLITRPTEIAVEPACNRHDGGEPSMRSEMPELGIVRMGYERPPRAQARGGNCGLAGIDPPFKEARAYMPGGRALR